MNYKRILTLALLVIGLVPAGCGGSGKTTSASNRVSSVAGVTGSTTQVAALPGNSSKALSGAELIARADVVCRRLNTGLVDAKDKIQNRADILRISQRRAGVEQAALIELGKLIPPPSLAHDWQQILAARQLLIDELGEIKAYAQANNREGERSVLAASVNVQRQITITASRDGFKDCSHIG